MPIYIAPLILLTLLYICALLKLRQGLRRLPPGTQKNQPHVSIIISAKDEEENIETCLYDVLDQTYPATKLEVIVIDDRSQDRTAERVRKIVDQNRHVKLLQVRDKSRHLAPKKRAIDFGIRHATGEIIVTTDADCRPGTEWIHELVKHFDADVGLVAGYNPYRARTSRKSLFQEMLRLDYFAMACVAAASAGLDYPISCSGGNLAYRKKVYEQIGGFKNIGGWVSGDDDLFLERVRTETDWKIRYSINPKTFVPTAPPADLTEFWQQRLRYASKCGRYKPSVTATLIGVYFLNLLLLCGSFLVLFAPKAGLIWLGLFLAKACAERAFLIQGRGVFGESWRPSTFWLTALLHPLYITLAGALGQIATFEWKKETHSARLKLRREAPLQAGLERGRIDA